MKIHEAICDKCLNHQDLEYNGEHWLIPEDWRKIIDRNFNQEKHLCKKCYKRLKLQTNET